jgi:hypothetical protein
MPGGGCGYELRPSSQGPSDPGWRSGQRSRRSREPAVQEDCSTECSSPIKILVEDSRATGLPHRSSTLGCETW